MPIPAGGLTSSAVESVAYAGEERGWVRIEPIIQDRGFSALLPTKEGPSLSSQKKAAPNFGGGQFECTRSGHARVTGAVTGRCLFAALRYSAEVEATTLEACVEGSRHFPSEVHAAQSEVLVK